LLFILAIALLSFCAILDFNSLSSFLDSAILFSYIIIIYK
jgi:hypothetical protein